MHGYGIVEALDRPGDIPVKQQLRAKGESDMAQFSNDRASAEPTVDSIGHAASAAAGAGSEFFARAIELVGRQISDAIVQALKPSGSGETGGRIDSVLSRYRGALGEMALHLPMVARRLVQAQEEPPGSAQWLFRATLDSNRRKPVSKAGVVVASPMPVLSDLDGLTPPRGESMRVLITAATRDRMEDVYGDAFAGKARKALPLVQENELLQSIPGLLDKLKYAFRKDGVRSLPETLAELEELSKPYLPDAFDFVATFKTQFGEKCAHVFLTAHVVDQFARAWKLIPRGVDTQLRKAFGAAGIVLSNQITLIATGHGWSILDHETDRVFEARRQKVAPRRPADSYVDVYGPPNCPYRCTVQGKDLLLPVRVADASHGVAVWSVDKQLVQEHLKSSGKHGLRAWDIGQNRSAVALFMTKHREGDLESYGELGLMCFVTPRKDPLAVGMIVVHPILATPGLGLTASNEIWAASKDPAELDFETADRSATMKALDTAGRPLITVTMPRGGDGSSSNVPLFLYSYKGEILHRTIVTRSGTGESMRAGGVGLSIDVSRAGQSLSICKDLHAFGILDKNSEPRRALFTAWSECVSAELPRPTPVYEREDDD